jgi:hypothetical protein
MGIPYRAYRPGFWRLLLLLLGEKLEVILYVVCGFCYAGKLFGVDIGCHHVQVFSDPPKSVSELVTYVPSTLSQHSTKRLLDLHVCATGLLMTKG